MLKDCRKNHFCREKGQYSIEYIVMLLFIMVGIFMMGNYVRRSWNANLKGWEESIYDSQTDPLMNGNVYR